MSKRELFALAAKFLGLLFAVYAVVAIPGVIQSIHMFASDDFPGLSGSRIFLITALLSFVLQAAAAIVLITCADGIASALVSDDRELPLSDVQGWRKPVFEIALRVFGVVLVAYGIPGLVQTIGESYVSFTRATGEGIQGLYGEFLSQTWNKAWPDMIANLVRVATGFWLMFGAAGVSSFILERQGDADAG